MGEPLTLVLSSYHRLKKSSEYPKKSLYHLETNASEEPLVYEARAEQLQQWRM